MSQEKTHKTSDPKISSHTSLFWTLPEQLSKLQHALPQICPKPMSQEKTHKTSDPKISSQTSLFWTLPEQLSKLQRAFPQICPKPLSREKPTKPQTPRFHLTHPCFELCRNSSPSYSAHFRKSVLNQCPKKKKHKTSDLKISSHTSLFWTLPEQLSKLHRGLSALNMMPAGIIHNHSFLQSHPLWPKKKQGINIGIHVFWPCLLMSFDVFWCLLMSFRGLIYIYIFK